MKEKNKCIKCSENVWIGNKRFRNYWQLFCWKHEVEEDHENIGKITTS